MEHFTAQRLTFTLHVQTLLELNEHQGSALRGALFHALRRRFCAFARQSDLECSGCALAPTCPVATLVSTLNPQHARGQDRPRPFTIQPPLPGSGHPWELPNDRFAFRYEPGETLIFGLTLYAGAMTLFPYVVLALQDFEEGGLGRACQQYDGRWRRGQVAVREIWAQNPLTGERQPVLRQGSRQVYVPDIPVTHAQVLTRTSAWQPSAGGVTLNFATPTRLVERGHLLKPESFRFRPLLQRLLERLEALSEAFCDSPLAVDFPGLLAAAEAVRTVENQLRWEDVASYSTRRHAESPIGGLVGRVTLAAETWAPFLPWLLWAQFTHVGKDAVKGNGMLEVE